MALDLETVDLAMVKELRRQMQMVVVGGQVVQENGEYHSEYLALHPRGNCGSGRIHPKEVVELRSERPRSEKEAGGRGLCLR